MTWISCKERLPDKDGRYLVYEKHPYYHWIGVCSLRMGKWDIETVKYWQELPLPPPEETSE